MRGRVRRSAANALQDQTRDRVRIGVGVGAAILGVTLAILGDLPRDADAGAAVGHAVAELVVGGGLVCTREATLDVVAVTLDVRVDPFADRLARRLDRR